MNSKRVGRGSTRSDEGRRRQIGAAALDVIRKGGIGGLTHRAIAQEAAIPLGLTTYHFSSLDDILETAFDLAMEKDISQLTAWIEALDDGADLPSEFTSLIMGLTTNDTDNVYLNFEMILAAVHRPFLQQKAHAWATYLSQLLLPGMTADAASAVAVVYDGTLLRQAVTGKIGDQSEVEASFRRACGDECVWRRTNKV